MTLFLSVARCISGYDFSLVVDLKNLGANPAATISQVARLRRNCFAAVFSKFFQYQKVRADARKQADRAQRERGERESTKRGWDREGGTRSTEKLPTAVFLGGGWLSFTAL